MSGSRAVSYGVAVLAAAVATALKVALAAYVVPTFILAYPAVLLAAAQGGIGPGILATVLSAFGAWLWVLPPPGELHPLSVQEAVALALFLAMGALMSVLAERLRRSQGRVQALETARMLQAAEAKFRTYVEASPDALLVADGTGRLVDANPAALEMLGIDLATLKGSTIDEFVHEEDRAWASERFGEVKSSGHVEYDRRFVRPDGRVVWVRVRGVKLSDDRMLAYCRDVTEKRAADEELQRREARLRAYFDTPAVGIAITGSKLEWVEVNDRLCAMTGYSRAELLRIPWPRLSYPEDLPADVVQFNRLLAGDVDRYSIDKRFIRKDGSLLWAMVSMSCVRKADGAVDTVIGIIKDITERKRAEVALRATQVENEKLIAELREALLNVKTLTGLLPICMYCKKIRNDTGYWDRIETYISSHTDARFSHGMCEECFREQHPDMVDGVAKIRG